MAKCASIRRRQKQNWDDNVLGLRLAFGVSLRTPNASRSGALEMARHGVCFVGVCASLLGAGRSQGKAPKGGATPKIDFVHAIAPLITARSARCQTHGKYKGSVSMDTRADLLKSKVVVPGKSAVSELVKRITSDDPEKRMPSKGKPLSAKEIALIKAWIDQGVPWDAGFTFKKST